MEKGIRHSGLLTSHTVTGRPRRGTGVYWTNSQIAQLIHPGNACSTASYLDYVNHGNSNRVSGVKLVSFDCIVCGQLRRKILQQARLGGRTTTIQDNDIFLTDQFCQFLASNNSSYWPRLYCFYRYASGEVKSRDSSAGEHHIERAAKIFDGKILD